MPKAIKSSEVLQTFFVWAAAAFYVSQFVQTVYQYSMIPSDQRTANDYSAWFAMHAMVALIWLGVWLSKRKRELTTQTLFDVTLVTTTLMLLMWSVGTIPFLFPSFLQQLSNGGWFETVLFALPVLAVLPIAAGLILHLRRSKQW